MDEQESSFNLWQKERDFLAQESKKNPTLFISPEQIDTEQILGAIGITALPKARPLGYLKLWPQDFIVEELDRDNSIHTIDPAPFLNIDSGYGENFSAEMVKVGANTLDVLEDLARALKVERRFIGFGGMKDQDALTSQLITFRKIDPTVLADKYFDHFFLKNVRRNNRWAFVGSHKGNVFTIAVRANNPFAPALEQEIGNISRGGCWNFYYTQRFGTPRLLDHFLGKYLLQGDYRELVKQLFCLPMKRELPYLQELRKKLGESFGDWDKMLEIISPLPYTFRREILMLEYLKNNPEDFRGAISKIPEVVKIWAISYASFLFNQALSIFIQKGNVIPGELPLVLSSQAEVWEFYRNFLERDRIKFPSPAFEDFPYIMQVKEQMISTRFRPWISHAKKEGQIFVIRFSLPRGAYATTFLAHLFTLQTGLPVPKDIPTDPIDAKKILGTGSVEETLKRLGSAVVSKLGEKEK